ncbi:MAG: ribonuclease H-like domain-containing protein [Patescibacteria group bacterium]
MRIITFDIETIGEFRNGPRAFENLELTICCIHDSETDSYDSFLKEDLPRLWKIFEHTDALVGFNSDHFDIPILNKYYPGDLSKIRSIDLLKEISAVLGRRVRLDAVAEGTLGSKKSASGLQAMQWWKEDNIKKLREYCLKDVEITKKVFDYALKNGTLIFKELGIKKEVKLDTSKWLASPAQAGAALTKTLGF